MLLIDIRWAIVAVSMVGAIHWYLSRIELDASWGDLQSGLLFERTRRSLLKLEDELYHPKNWRPFVLALSGGGFSRPHLVVFGSWLTSERGVLTLGQVIPGELDEHHQRRISQEQILHTMVSEHSLSAFPAVVVASDYVSGVEALVQCQGLGRLRPNIVLLGYPMEAERMRVFGGLLRNVASLGRSVVVLRRTDRPENDWSVPSGTVDVWWRGRSNGELMVLLAHLILDHPKWQGKQLRLLRVVDNESASVEVRSNLKQLLREARIKGSTKVVVSGDPASAIQTTSRDAAMVFLGIEPPEEGAEEEFYYRTEALVGNLPRVALVQSAGGMRLES